MIEIDKYPNIFLWFGTFTMLAKNLKSIKLKNYEIIKPEEISYEEERARIITKEGDWEEWWNKKIYRP